VPVSTEPARDINVPIRVVPAKKPDWVDGPSENNTEILFKGKSARQNTEQEAKKNAIAAVSEQIVKHYSGVIESKAIGRSIFMADSNQNTAALAALDPKIIASAGEAVSWVESNQYYMEVFLNKDEKEEFVVYTVCSISKEEAERTIESFEKNISKPYTDLITEQNTLHAALSMYDDILSKLLETPLYRAIAYYENNEGEKVGLHEYLYWKLNELASSITFTPVPLFVIQKTDTLNTTTEITSEMDLIGPVRYETRIYQDDTLVKTEKSDKTITNNSIAISESTQTLYPGKYTIQIELLLNTISGQIQKNTVYAFPFEVSKVKAMIDFYGVDLTGIERESLSNSLENALDNNKVPVQLVAMADNVQNKYSFSFMINTTIQPPIPPVSDKELVSSYLSIHFIRNGEVIEEFAPNPVSTERSNANTIFSLTEKLICENKSFFQGIINDITTLTEEGN
jgi:hypothetical protein